MWDDIALSAVRLDQLPDLVSKYIGETEKNLAAVFAEAESSSALLFFDEVDALFGKRTQVGDSHDRYANVETSYLWQKIKHHQGVVGLATSLGKDIDDAFVRHFDFPVPGPGERLRIWAGIWPRQTPRRSGPRPGIARQQD
jgi:SpoVK/Ycf46/Vps4 family AAA+-type ATPase